MAEEPMQDEGWLDSEEEVESPSLVDRVKGGVRNIRERFAKGGAFALAVLFVVGVLFGIAAKTVAARSITMGYLDYTVSSRDKSAVNLNAVQQGLLAQQAAASAAQAAQSAPGASGGNANQNPSDTGAHQGSANSNGGSELPSPPPVPPAPPSQAPQGN